MNGAAVIAEILRREGTEFLSCYPRNPLIEACAALDIRPILCRQERVGVGMADGYTRIKRGKRNGVFAAQAGPGSVPPTCIGRSPNGARWRIRFRSCRI
jgi:acetolactate synthase I/II/III large subunit